MQLHFKVFRVFQTNFRTSGVSPGYSATALWIANKSAVKERISDDWRFCILAIGK
jgi:hypothetical protein